MNPADAPNETAHGTSVGRDKFLAAFEPVVAATRAVIDEAEQARGHALPMPGSEALFEVEHQNEEVPLRTESSDGVIDVGRSLTSLAFAAGEAHVRAYLVLLEHAQHPFVWGMPVLARAAIEAFATTRYLAERGIGLRRRAGRVMNAMVSNELEIIRVGKIMNPATVRLPVRAGQAEAAGLIRLPARKGRPPMFEEATPSITQQIRELVGEGVGPVIYAAWSSIAHANVWGLGQAVDRDFERGPAGAAASLLLRSDDVTTHLGLLLLAHLSAFDQYAGWHGWTAPGYGTALGHANGLLGFLGDERRPEAAPERLEIARRLLHLPSHLRH